MDLLRALAPFRLHLHSPLLSEILMSQSIDRAVIDTMEKRYRANLFNSLTGYKSANLLGTINDQGQTNLALMTSVFHVGAHPPLVGMLIRPHSVPRHSLENLMQTGVYTLNVVTASMYQQAHQSSARYDRDVSEFEAVGFDEEYSDSFKAPYVAQSPIRTGLSLLETQTLKMNDTVLVIGEVVELNINDKLIADDGQLDLNAADAVAVSGLNEYHSATSLDRLPYAKVR